MENQRYSISCWPSALEPSRIATASGSSFPIRSSYLFPFRLVFLVTSPTSDAPHTRLRMHAGQNTTILPPDGRMTPEHSHTSRKLWLVKLSLADAGLTAFSSFPSRSPTRELLRPCAPSSCAFDYINPRRPCPRPVYPSRRLDQQSRHVFVNTHVPWRISSGCGYVLLFGQSCKLPSLAVLVKCMPYYQESFNCNLAPTYRTDNA
jgi:hypothetical protein